MKNKLLYIYPKKATFINNDISFLEKKYQVVTQDLDWGNPKKLIVNFYKQFLFLLKHSRTSYSIIINFGGYFSYLPTLLGKWFGVNTYIILNGTDCVSFPAYNYGSLRKKILKYFIYKSYKRATKLFPVDASLVQQTHTFDDEVNQKKQGIRCFFPTLKTPVSVIPNGLDSNFWTTKSTIKKTGFISVGFVNSLKSFRVKGIDMILKTAELFPNEKFTIVGISDAFKSTLQGFPTNVITIPYLEKEALKKAYQEHEFYLQVSVNEGFGCALVEAMLTGCIPIVSNVGALPNVTKNKGFIIKKKDINHFKNTIKKALDLSDLDRKSIAREVQENSIKNFDISVRERLLLQEIEN
ncbi:glycosyltransferase family 4 protein [Polaribacter porphyrae]|uniref:Glycosyl transferase family 1 domain-containing protein n=1 Tax=Polaribacter porphyrae TaxID=1137780 RepID=A0A2S7WN58_9FLAO|nr:glycosyltransferase family 4 protein [Polaribacter porphyrae]PQJ79044.1 hypothetical protein BTO18_07605 [Polaribacter porphyrae]